MAVSVQVGDGDCERILPDGGMVDFRLRNFCCRYDLSRARVSVDRISGACLRAWSGCAVRHMATRDHLPRAESYGIGGCSPCSRIHLQPEPGKDQAVALRFSRFAEAS